MAITMYAVGLTFFPMNDETELQYTGPFLPGSVSAVARHVADAKEILNVVYRADLQAARMKELSGEARDEMTAALAILELILCELHANEFSQG